MENPSVNPFHKLRTINWFGNTERRAKKASGGLMSSNTHTPLMVLGAVVWTEVAADTTVFEPVAQK